MIEGIGPALKNIFSFKKAGLMHIQLFFQF